MIIREATLADAAGIAKVHVDCWRTTYKHIISNDYLEKLSYEQRTELWINNISKEGNYVFVAENKDGQIIGFAGGGKRVENKVEHSGDVTSIYILKEFQGMGIGKKLIRKLFSKFEERQFNTIFVEVLEDNKSKLFYEALGAQLFDSTKITIAGSELNLLIYQWKNIC
ncbi:GNAT family N-acetyltransferase [Psychrobacillus vulpis]|uniref:GNAT family N-acetyltransferase n=1 Tax=Psychrobacillus vulpis TaxID=2325572 RepID=A0A544TP54_9BACI|nr:GNAT family N-acetyltransferase [Psychrobacillus vulpis]TQR19172.1 GNAT family N-acetyltransferase [Psychrobacillus vulpis]